MTALSDDLRAEIETVPEQIESDLLYVWADDKFDRSNALDLALECTLRAAEIAVEHERKRLMELVCAECGGETDSKHGDHVCRSCEIVDPETITRAEYERTKR